MASLQQTRPSSHINPKHNHHDLMRVLKGVQHAKKHKPTFTLTQFQQQEDEEKDDHQHEVVDTTVGMLNKGNNTVKLENNKNWRGDVHGALPDTIEVSKDQQFSHIGKKYGSKGAVIYRGPGGGSGGGCDNCAWLLAWSAIGDNTPNKVYIETGPIENYRGRNLNWDDINEKLEKSSSSVQCRNDETKTSGSAQIDNSNTDPSVAATFDVTMK